jgi:glycosyltransferase involved in cell wall biosynthesis
MIRVTHLIAGLDVGGAEAMLQRIVTRMDRSEFDADVVSLIPPGVVGQSLAAAGVPVSSLGMRRGVPSLPGVARLIRHLHRRRPHVLQTWMYHADLAGLLASRLVRRPAVLWNIRAADMDMTRYGWLSAWTVATCARLSALPDAIVVNSTAGLRFHERNGFAPKAWHLIPNGVDLAAFHPRPEARASLLARLRLPSDALIIGMFARFDPMKDHANLLEAAALFAQEEPRAHWLLAGEGMTPLNAALTGPIGDFGLAGRVSLLGLCEAVPELVAGIDIATLSSRSEASPNVVLEAMASAVPAVVTDVGDAAAILSDAGIVVAPRHPAALADGWRQLRDCGAEGRAALGRIGRERVEREFSLEAVVARYEELYRGYGGGGR